MVIYHDSFDKERVDEVTWDWDMQKVGFNCRIQVHADPALNGKLNVKILDMGDQAIHVIWQPKNYPNKYNENDGPWGLYEKGRIFYNVNNNHHDQVPTDWQFFVYYYVMYLNMFSSKRIVIKSWV